MLSLHFSHLTSSVWRLLSSAVHTLCAEIAKRGGERGSRYLAPARSVNETEKNRKETKGKSRRGHEQRGEPGKPEGSRRWKGCEVEGGSEEEGKKGKRSERKEATRGRSAMVVGGWRIGRVAMENAGYSLDSGPPQRETPIREIRGVAKAAGGLARLG